MDLVRDKRVKDAYMNSTLQNMFNRGELRKDHPLQRKPDRWSKSDKDGLVSSVIKDEDIDSIKVCEELTPNGVILWVIDGLQRLTVLSSFRNGGFKIGQNVEFPIITYQSTQIDNNGNIVKDKHGNYIYKAVEYDLRGKNYSDLPVELKEKYDNYKIDVVKHLDCTDEEIGYHIRRYNKQKSMNGSENAVTYMDNIAKQVKNISLNNRLLNKYDIYTQTEINNGTVDRIVTETVMCMFHLDNWQKQSKKMGLFLNDNSSREEFDKLNDNLNRLETIFFDELRDLFTSKDSFIWFTLFDRFTNMHLDDNEFVIFLTAFRNRLKDRKINGETFYEIDRNKSTKDKSVIIKKLNLLEKLMNEFLKKERSIDINLVDEKIFISDNVGIDEKILQNNIELYNETLDDLQKAAIKQGSKLLDKQNRLSLLAMMAYSYKEDKDLDAWMVEYAKKNDTYLSDQKENFLYMKQDFEKFITRLSQK